MTKDKNKYFNIMLSRDMIAQAYHENLRYYSHCFLQGYVMGDIPEPYKIDDEIYIEDGHLKVIYHQHAGYQKFYYINHDGHLMCIIKEGDIIMNVVDLGQVAAKIEIGTTTTGAEGSDASVINVGTDENLILNFTIPRGNTGATGPQGPEGPEGPQGPEGSLPDNFVVSFSDGTSADGTYTETP